MHSSELKNIIQFNDCNESHYVYLFIIRNKPLSNNCPIALQKQYNWTKKKVTRAQLWYNAVYKYEHKPYKHTIIYNIYYINVLKQI